MPLAETLPRRPVPGAVVGAALRVLVDPNAKDGHYDRNAVLEYSPGMCPVAAARRILLRACDQGVTRECRG